MTYSAHSRWSEDAKAIPTSYNNCTQNKWIIQHIPGDLRTQKQHSHPITSAHRTNDSFSTLQVIWEHKSNTHKLWKLHMEQMNHSVHSRWPEDTKATLTAYENCTQNKWIIQHIPQVIWGNKSNTHKLWKLQQNKWIIWHTLQVIWGYKSNTHFLWKLHTTNESFSRLQVIWGCKGNTHLLSKLHTEQMYHSAHSRWSEDTKATLTFYQNCPNTHILQKLHTEQINHSILIQEQKGNLHAR
jgi:hypothetical protein